MTDEQWYPWEESERGVRKRSRPWLWIGLPLLLGVFLTAGMIAAVLMTGFGTTQTWADISLVIVMLPLCLMGIIPMVVLIGLSYGIGRLVGWLPEPLQQVDMFLARAARETRRGGALLTRPMIALQGLLAMGETFLRGLIELIR